jgi:HSP20 family molecular chaperone IbpA
MSEEIQPKESALDVWSDLDRVFDEMRSQLWGVWDLRPFGATFAPIERTDGGVFRAARTDVTDAGKAYQIIAEVPGIPKDKLDIRVRGTSVEIRGENSQKNESKDGEFVHRERIHAGYYRRLELPEPVLATEAKAKVENGVLELELPKEHPTAPAGEVKIAVQ